FTSAEANLVQQGNTLAEVIENNTSITNLQSNVFLFTASISGHAYADPDGNGVQGDTEPGLAGVTVDLVDDSGARVARAVTNSSGAYTFTNQTGIPGTGNFTVALDAAANPHLAQTAAQVAQDPAVGVSRGGLSFTNQDLGVIGTQVNFLGGFGSTAG